MIFDRKFIGKNGFYWFIGTVEDRNDPLKLGRVRVRCRGLHDKNKAETKTEDLPWAMPLMPVTSASVSGIGQTPALVEGSWVVGFFMDGSECQEPVIMGSFLGIPIDAPNPQEGFNDPRTSLTGTPKTVTGTSFTGGVHTSFTEVNAGPFPNTVDKPDTHNLVRPTDDVNNNSVMVNKTTSRSAGQIGVAVAGGGSFSEPVLPYNAVYPYNKVIATESGHVIEMDDTPGAERIHIYHRSGSFVELHPDGKVVFKSIKTRTDIMHGDHNQHVEGNAATTVDGTLKILANGALTIQVPADLNIIGNVNITGDVTSDGTVWGKVEVKATALQTKLSTHVHTSAAPGSPTSSPTPGS